MTEQEAIQKLTSEYKEKFGADPDQFAQIMCKTMAHRLVSGENIVWKQEGKNWRSLGVAQRN